MNSFRSLVLPLRLRDRYGLWSAAIAALCKWRFRRMTLPGPRPPGQSPVTAPSDRNHATPFDIDWLQRTQMPDDAEFCDDHLPVNFQRYTGLRLADSSASEPRYFGPLFRRRYARTAFAICSGCSGSSA